MDGQNVCDLLQQIVKSLSKSTSLNLQFFAAPNPVTVPVGKPICILQVNADRKGFRISNLGNTTVQLFYQTPDGGMTPLSASGSAGDGSGNIITDEIWTGAVFANSISNPGSIEVMEFI